MLVILLSKLKRYKEGSWQLKKVLWPPHAATVQEARDFAEEAMAHLLEFGLAKVNNDKHEALKPSLERFLNRTFSLPFATMNPLIDYLLLCMSKIGETQPSLVDVTCSGKPEISTLVQDDTPGSNRFEVQLVRFSVDRGVSFARALDLVEQAKTQNRGYHFLKKDDGRIVLAVETSTVLNRYVRT